MSDIREAWLATVVGKALNPDRFAGNQCVDTVDHFGEFIFGVPWPQCVGGVRGAKDLLDRAPDAYWIRIDYFHGFIPQRFDVLVYAGDTLNEWGHTAVTESATKTYIDVVQQDGFAAPHQFVDGNWYSAKPAHRARLAYSARGTGPLLGVLRPRPEKLRGGITLQSSTITPAPAAKPKEWDEMATPEEIAAIVRRVVWGGKDGTMIHNYRLGRGEYPETVLGAIEGRMQNEILPAVVVAPLQQQLGGLAAKVDALATALAAKPDNPLTKEEALAQLDASVKASFGEYTPVLVRSDTVTEGATSNG